MARTDIVEVVHLISSYCYRNICWAKKKLIDACDVVDATWDKISYAGQIVRSSESLVKTTNENIHSLDNTAKMRYFLLDLRIIRFICNLLHFVLLKFVIFRHPPKVACSI